MIWQALVILLAAVIAFVKIRRFATHIADERAERERQRNVEEAIKTKKLSDVANRLRPTYALDENPSAVSPPLNPIVQPKTQIQTEYRVGGLTRTGVMKAR
jgi:hypothetical protein